MNSLSFGSSKQAARRAVAPIALVIVCCACGCGPSKATEKYVRNGGFEKVEQGLFQDWQYGRGPEQTQPRIVRGAWQKLTCKVMNQKGEDSVRFFFWTLQGSTGSVWIDNVRVSRGVPTLRNLSFEETDENGGIAGWEQDRNGTIFSDSTRSSHGQRSLRMTRNDGTQGNTRIWQKIPLEPGKEYSISFDYFVSDDFVGTAQGYVLGGTHGSTRQHNPMDTRISTPRSQNEKYVCALIPARDKPADLYQRVALKPGVNLEACIEVNRARLKGDIRLIVEDGASKKVLGESSVGEAKQQWHLLRVPFESRSSEIVLRVVAQGEGEVEVDNVMVTSPEPTPPLQHVEWYPASKNFRLPSTLKVSVEGKSGVVLAKGLSLLAGDLTKKFGLALERVTSGRAAFTIAIGEQYALKGKGDESYSIKINRRGIAIEAGKEPGAFYGIMTVLQLLTTRDGGPVALGCRAKDYPDMPMRGVLYGNAEQAARWKMNTLMYSCGYLRTHAKEPAWRPGTKNAVTKFISEECPSLNLNVIPYFMTLNGNLPLKTNPNLAAGIWVKDEKVVLRGTTPSFLANKFVIRTDLTDVTLTSLDGKKPYRLGKDYRVINGDISYPYTQKNPKLFAVARTPDSAIPDGATVIAGYDYVSHYRKSTQRSEFHIPSCPVEPQAREIMGTFVKNVAREFPVSYIHITSCLEEFRPSAAQLATDSRCIKSGKSPIELLAEYNSFLDKAAKSGNPDVRISVWAGHVNEYSRIAGPKLPKDAMVNIWGYDASWPVIAGRASIAYWSKLGITTSVMPWYDIQNVRGWAQVVAEARAKGYPCLGMIDVCWKNTRVPDPAAGIEETAIVSWKIPRKGDRRYVELPPAGPEN